MKSPAKPAPSGGEAKKKRTVTFAASHTSFTIPAEYRVSPTLARERTRALKYRRSTPHKRSNRQPSHSPASAKKKPRLVESGAVRVQIARHTNPRRDTNKHGSGRLIDQGAVRVHIVRHTTPRRLYATRNRIWSPPPQSSPANQVVQSEIIDRRKAEANNLIPTTVGSASKPRSSAYIGGHQFQSMFSPIRLKKERAATTPSSELYKENNGNGQDERDLSRTLFD